MAQKATPESEFYDCCDYCGRIYPPFSGRAYDHGPEGEDGLWYYCNRHDCTRPDVAE